jgi:hypothetical protein
VSDHALTTLTYQGVEVIDPYITTQVNGTHKIARRMSDELKYDAKTPSQYLNKSPRILTGHKGYDHWHNLKF